MLISRQSEWVEVRRLENRGRGGRGIFARTDIPAGTLLERVPVILMPRSDVFGSPADPRRAKTDAEPETELSWYAFSWESISPGVIGVALGYGSIYNHSFSPNADYKPVTPDLLDFHALRAIAAGEEILINYYTDRTKARTDL